MVFLGNWLDFGMFSSQLLNILFIIVWLILSILCLIKLRKQEMPANSKAMWSLVILLIPILGSVGFLIVNPGEDNHI